MVNLNVIQSLTSLRLDGLYDHCSNWHATLIIGMDEVFSLQKLISQIQEAFRYIR